MSGPAVLDTLVSLEERAAGEPPWLGAARRRASAWIAEHGFPTRKQEDWRYSEPEEIAALRVAAPAAGAGDSALPAGPDLGGARVVLVDGRYSPGLSSLSGPAPGVRVTPLAAAIAAGDPALEALWAPGGGGYRHAFEALNAALAVDGVLVEVAEGTPAGSPIEIAHLSVGHDGRPLSVPRTVVVAAAGSSVTVVESFTGAGVGGYLVDAHTCVVTGPEARVDHYKLQADADAAVHLSTLDVRPGPGSHVASRLLALGGRLGRHEVTVRLGAEGAAADLAGLYLPAGESRHDNPILVDHAAPRCTSRQLFKGIVGGSGHGVFNGHVVVGPGAPGTEAHQTNKNLLLSDRAEVDTRPRLEIFTDDVACTHGAAVGQIDADALFYLRSRGIPEHEARAVLIRGFAQEVLDLFEPGPIRRRAEHLLDGHLARWALLGGSDAGGHRSDSHGGRGDGSRGYGGRR